MLLSWKLVDLAPPYGSPELESRRFFAGTSLVWIKPSFLGLVLKEQTKGHANCLGACEM